MAWFSVPAAAFRFTAAEPGYFRSSPHVLRSFCPACGTTLTYKSDTVPEIDVTICSLDAPDEVAPADHTEAADKLGRDAVCDGRPVYPRSRSEGLAR